MVESEIQSMIYRIPPLQYIHVLNLTSNVTKLEVGPKTYVRKEQEEVVTPLTDMIIIPPHCYCIVSNPVVKASDNQVLFDKNGQAELKHGDAEVRFTQDPFPLYPGEEILQEIAPLQVVEANHALTLMAKVEFCDSNGETHKAGDLWLFYGPGIYCPRIEEEVVKTVAPITVLPLHAIWLKAIRTFTTREGMHRVAGEEWLMRTTGTYLPNAYEEVENLVEPILLDTKHALLLAAKQNFTDIYGVERAVGEEWLVTSEMAKSHTPDVYEIKKGIRDVITLPNDKWCIIKDPRIKGVNDLGARTIIKGPTSFFLQPGEKLEGGIRSSYVINQREALVLEAHEFVVDSSEKSRIAGERWLLEGPIQYFPPIEIQVVEVRERIDLESHEGIYVRNILTGDVRLVKGEPYLLQINEELWSKGTHNENSRYSHLIYNSGTGKKQVQSAILAAKALCYKLPPNSAMRLFDYRTKKSRTMFGPSLVTLNPYEDITLCNLRNKPSLFSRFVLYCQTTFAISSA